MSLRSKPDTKGPTQARERIQAAIEAALELAFSYGQIDGDHHKLWVIDQMVRVLTGDGYDDWVNRYENEGEYIWEVGIAP